MSDIETYLAECEAAANDAAEIASMTSEQWVFDENSHELQKVLLSGQPVKIGHIVDHHDGTFVAHARTSNPDLAARVIELVKMVRERDEKIGELSATAGCLSLPWNTP